ncbi:MAG: carbamoyltransferase [Acidobacteriota bacterium]|nr:carbamoyltransferase [Acidobacteriota bacterium]
MILGIYHPANGHGHDTGVALVHRDGRIVAAMSEERLSRVKMDGGFPFRALETVMAIGGVRAADLDAVAVPFLSGGAQLAEGARMATRSLADPAILRGQLALRLHRDRFQAGMRALDAYGYVDAFNAKVQAVRDADGRPLVTDWRGFLRVSGLDGVKLVQVDHHLAHAAGAWFASGSPDPVVITCDGVGALKSGIVAAADGSRLRVLARTFYPHSPGEFWELITVICGFHHMKHGGKITGLAAYGNPAAPCYEVMRRALSIDGLTLRTALDPLAMAASLRGVPREDIAATAQRRLIEVVTALVENAMRATGRRSVALSGGVFGNVRLNQAIAELPGVDDVFVFPAMGDEGLGIGAAWHTALTRYGATPARQPHMYWGPEYTEQEMSAALAAHGLKAERLDDRDLADRLAVRLAGGEVAAVCRGRLELGPRALGHRTILYQTGDASVNDWLNKRLDRTEFMPFAPVTLAEHADACYEGLDKYRHAAEFMTVTSTCTPSMRAASPAVVHLDGTARPQLIRREIDPFYYDTLAAYHARTGIPSLVNTSFNMHEEPIVCTPDDAVRAFLRGHIDCLVLGPFLVEHPDRQARA